MNKKVARPQKEESSYEIRDIVLAKVRGYPPWPGMIVDPESVPPGVSKERPGSKKTAFYCVRFFPAGDYAWLVPKDISKLQTHEIEAYISEPYKRSGDLLTGYRIALDPKKWEEERDAAGFEAGEAEADAEIDQLDSEDDDEINEKKHSKSKKRKRESELSSAKVKVRNKKKGSAEPSGRKKSGSTRGKKNGGKSKAMVESEDDGDQAEGDDAGPSKSSPPPTKKAKRERDEDDEARMSKDPEAMKVRDWRHKLQKTFLSNKNLPKEEDMPTLDVLFTTVENYTEMTIQYLSFSKIGKVMRHIAALSPEKVPRDDEFKFRDRAKVLVDKWHQILSSNKPNGADAPANGMKPEGGDHEAVTDGTAAIDLNGDAHADDSAHPTNASEPAVEPANPDGTLGDITMSEA